MTREIKFRAWDGSKMHHEGVVMYLGEAWIEKLSFESDKILLESTNPCVHMQFTGLLDKNGKEIYEGDILEFETPGGTRRPYVEYQSDLAAFVLDYWKKGKQESRGDFLHEVVEGIENEVEIIGNVHENPELLSN